MAGAIGDTVDKLTQLIEIKVEQLKLKLIEKAASILANIISLSFALVIIFFLLFFVSLGCANLVNELLKSNFWGYFIMSGFYLVSIIIIAIFLKSKALQGWLESLILNATEDKEEDEKD